MLAKSFKFGFVTSTFETSTRNKPQYDDQCKNCSSYHQFHLEVLEPHLPAQLSTLPLEAISLYTKQAYMYYELMFQPFLNLFNPGENSTNLER